jgi:putative ATPase
MSERTYTPLAEKMRPQKLSDVVGQEQVLGDGKIINLSIKAKSLKSMIFWGPPGVGKTTLARIIARESGARFVEISAVSSGKADVRRVVDEARDYQRMGENTILFIDEIHRFNKAQQDFLLPFVEDGTITLIGATTENPSFEVIAPLLSRASLVVLKGLDEENILTLLKRAKKFAKGKSVRPAALKLISQLSGGDARRALNIFETAIHLAKKTIDVPLVEEAAQQLALKYDKGGEEHYNTISAYIKSMRGSDVDASLFYLQRMLDSGEDPKFIARRLVIFASEDIGMASPHALTLAVAVFNAVERVGMPEVRYILSHGTIAMAGSKKSRAVADAMYASMQSASEHYNKPVPLHLRNAPTKMMKDLGYQEGYEWQTDFKHPDGFLPKGIEETNFYKF